MATSLNQFLENVEKVLECAICFKRLQNPKSLICFHSFCLACLEDWVKANGKLTCPTCSKLYHIPEGGLQKLPPNTFINNLLETIEQFSENEQMKCVCGKGQAKYYCQECRQYLCSTCSDHHKDFRLFTNHKLHSVEDVQSMTPLQIASLHPPLCSLHDEPLKFFCVICNIPICTDCAITDHSAGDGNHKPISISKAFQKFKETSAVLEKAAIGIKEILQNNLQAVTCTATELEQSKITSLRDIDYHVQQMLNDIMENGHKLKNEVEAIYKKRKAVIDVQMDELKTTISDINIKLSFLNHLLKSDEATAMQSSETVITALKDRINDLPNSELNDNELIHVFINEDVYSMLRECNIGYVKYKKDADCFELEGDKAYLETPDFISVGINNTDKCEIHANQLKATWTMPTGETHINHAMCDWGYRVTGKCRGPGIYQLDVTVYDKSIKQSPLILKIEEEGLVNNIQINQELDIKNVVKCEDDCLLVSCLTNEILRYKQSGEYIGKITLPQGVSINRMNKMKNGNIAFSDVVNKCITTCNMNGQVVKSIGQEVLKDPAGIHVDEASNIVYVADWQNGCVFMFDIDTGQMIRKTGSQGKQEGQMGGVIDVTLTSGGNLLVLEYNNSRLQLFDNEGTLMEVLIEAGDKDGELRNPSAVVSDEDGNIIISSQHKLQLFNSDGSFIKRIDDEEDGINPWGFSIISHNPQRVAVVNTDDKTIKIFNYTESLPNKLVLSTI